MIFIVHTEPQFLISEDTCLETASGPYYLEEGRYLGLSKTDDERLIIGTGRYNSDQLEIKTKTTAQDLLEKCQPATFEVGLDDEGDETIKAVLSEHKSTITEKIEKINLIETTPLKTILVNKIR